MELNIFLLLGCLSFSYYFVFLFAHGARDGTQGLRDARQVLPLSYIPIPRFLYALNYQSFVSYRSGSFIYFEFVHTDAPILHSLYCSSIIKCQWYALIAAEVLC
jgi:hypothetical protein